MPKVQLLADYFARFPRKILIETGLDRGWGSTMGLVESWKNNPLKRHIIIDWKPENVEIARRNSSIEVYLGDSALVLRGVLSEIAEPAFFWLDAHGEISSPLWAELGAIVDHPYVREHVVIVDDVRMIAEPWSGFPHLDEVLELAAPYWDVENKDDILRLTPR